MTFKYTGYNSLGVDQSGNIEAADKESAVAKLREDGLFLYDIVPAADDSPSAKPAPSALFPPIQQKEVSANPIEDALSASLPNPNLPPQGAKEAVSDPVTAAPAINPPRPSDYSWQKDPRTPKLAANIEAASAALRTVFSWIDQRGRPETGMPKVGAKTWEVIEKNLPAISSAILSQAIWEAYRPTDKKDE